MSRRAAAGNDPVAIATLRAAGPTGLDALLAVYDTADEASQLRMRPAIDSVAGQRDAYASRLYWYTDLEAAEHAARTSGKPILSLRLLGRLDQELSCANSRFFRVALYANGRLSRRMRDDFVLHWSTERPAPVLTIDYGDGRKVVRTVTGNSLHYAFDSRGRLLDALPGLYGPGAFGAWLDKVEGLAKATANFEGDARDRAVAQYHRNENVLLATRWTAEAPPGAVRFAAYDTSGNGPPSALVAAPMAASKAVVEIRPVRALVPWSAGPEPSTEAWAAIGARHLDDARVDASSRALMRAKHPMNWSDARPRELTTEEFGAVVRSFERSMAEDAAHDEFVLHARIHEWIANAPGMDWARLNTMVYAALFLTPKSDPWLGLMPARAFTAIDADGLVPAR
jgi:hypothetical protein